MKRVYTQRFGILDQIPFIFLFLNFKGEIQWANTEALAFFRKSSASLSGGILPTFFKKTERKRLEKALMKVEKGGQWQGLLTIEFKDGRLCSLDCEIVRCYDNTLKGFYFRATDVSLLWSCQTQLMKYQRTDTLGIVSSRIAHDLNNVLTTFTMSVKLLKQGVKDSDRVLTVLDEACKRSKDLVKEMVGTIRGVEGEKKRVLVNRTVNELMPLFKETFPPRIEMTTEFQPSLWPIYANPIHIHQVVMNLCVNAKDAIKRKKGEIGICCENVNIDEKVAEKKGHVLPGNYIHLKVYDTGDGIPENILSNVFDPFFTTKGPKRGTGLGLATVDAVVRKYGGYIDVESELNKGTTFHVYFPAMGKS